MLLLLSRIKLSKSLHMNTYKISMDKPITSTYLTYIKCSYIYTLKFKFKWVFQNGILKANTRFPLFFILNRCDRPWCCGLWRSNSKSIFPSRFMPAPVPYRHVKGPKFPNRRETISAGCRWLQNSRFQVDYSLAFTKTIKMLTFVMICFRTWLLKI